MGRAKYSHGRCNQEAHLRADTLTLGLTATLDVGGDVAHGGRTSTTKVGNVMT